MANFKKRTNKKRVSRKMFSEWLSIGEWSRMLHKSWMIWADKKRLEKKGIYD